MSLMASNYLCENFAAASTPARRPEVLLCPRHGEKLSLFCLDDERLACVACRGCDGHKKHRFEPVEEVARRRREELRELLKPLKKRAEVFDQALDEGRAYSDLMEIRRNKLRETEAGVRQRMDSLLGFLQREERARVAALREEATRKSRATKAKTEGLSGDTATLSDAIRAVDVQLRDEDNASFLCEYKPVEERLALTLQQDPRPVSGALVDVAGHLGNLAFKVWLKMKDVVPYSPVVLDPNTAGPGLIVSRDLDVIENWSLVPDDTPERTGQQDVGHNVLGSEGVSSGTHSWDVDTGGCDRWVLGVMADAYRRTGDSEGGFWEIMRYNTKYMAHSSSQGSTYLSVTDVQRVRVQLDWERGRLSFYDCDSDTLLHTFTHTFTQTLFPLFYNGDDGDYLRLLPGKVCVALESHT